MSIDERIEALTQSVELIASLHRDLEQSTAKNFERLTTSMERLTTSMERLTTVAIAHEERIERLEDKGN
jgi:predicted transcriptional regulator